MYVVAGLIQPLLGLQSIGPIGLVLRADEVRVTPTETDINAEYPAVFQWSGKLKDLAK